jgi:heme-degrading monooxygenase HmoA
VPAWHLAQLNVGRLVAPLDDPLIAEFVEALEAVNQLAERSAGFVWRLQTDEGNATAIRPYDDDQVLVNMSVWDSLEHLADFVYRSHHVEFLRRRHSWFERMTEPIVVLWWIEAGHVPPIDEAIARLEQLRTVGPSPAAFTFRTPFAAPDSAAAVEMDDRNTCPA